VDASSLEKFEGSVSKAGHHLLLH